MFDHLIESGHVARRGWAPSASSLAVHATVIIFAVAAVKRGPAENRLEPIAVTMDPFESPPATGSAATGAGGDIGILAAPASPAISIDPLAPPRFDSPFVPGPITIPAGDLARQLAGQGTTVGRVTDWLGAVGQDSLVAAEPPVPILLADPVYPPTLKNAGVEGSVTIEFVIGSNGQADSASVQILASDFQAFGEAARDAVLRSRFRPGRSNGQPVRVRVRQMVRFLVK